MLSLKSGPPLLAAALALACGPTLLAALGPQWTCSTNTALSARAQTSNWYPNSIALPSGHAYPCALTALPANLEGVPPGDRTFINHVYAMLLQCVQAKVLMLDALREDDGFGAAYSRYYASTTQARQKIMAEPVPAALTPFRNGVVAAIDQQIQFFSKASQARQRGSSFGEIMNIPEGRQASNYLLQAWSVMQGQYPSLSAAVKDSTYHHLCALDLF